MTDFFSHTQKFVVTKDDAGVATRIRMRKPADMHYHFRDDWRLSITAPLVAKRFGIVLAMPNLDNPIVTGQQMFNHHFAIGEAGAKNVRVLMTLYLTDTIDPEEVTKACSKWSPYPFRFAGIKYFPRGVTTNSAKGIVDPAALWTKGTKPYQALQILGWNQKVLLVHAADGVDKNGQEIDPFDQEKYFFENTLPRIREEHPNVKISIEHLSTGWGVEYMEKYAKTDPNLGCSLTLHHLLLDRRDVYRGGYRPHLDWRPVIQPQEHKQELRNFAKRGHKFVWLGSDSAAHSRKAKESNCCASGVMTAHAGIELYAEIFEDLGDLFLLEDFACFNGPRFYDIEPNFEELVLVREEWKVEKPFYCFVPPGPGTSGVEEIVPFRLGETVRWKLAA